MAHLSYLKHLSPLHVPSRIKPTESSALYITHTIRAFALALVGIFTPIFIFQLNNKPVLYSDMIVSNLIWVLLYFVVRHIVFLASTYFLTNFIFEKVGFRYSILLSLFFLVGWAIALYLSPQSTVLIMLAAILSGLEILFYWVPYHIFFIKKSGHHGNHYGKETSLRFFLVRIMNAIGPVFGGIMIALFGFKPLFITAIVLTIASAVPVILELKEDVHHKHDSWKIIKEYIFNKKHRKTTMGYIGQGIEDLVYVVFWPVLLFVILDNFSTIGFLSGLTLFLSSLSVLLVGRFVDKLGSSRVHSIGATSVSFFHVIRVFLSIPLFLYIVDIIDRVIGMFYSLPLMSRTYELAQQDNVSDFILYREYVLHTGILVTAVVAVFLVVVLPNWQWVFIFAAVGGALTRFLFSEKN